jgi:hypothetical protein
MLYREIIAVCSHIHTKPINTHCGQNVEFVNVKPGDTYSKYWALKAKAAMRLREHFPFWQSCTAALQFLTRHKRYRLCLCVSCGASTVTRHS